MLCLEVDFFILLGFTGLSGLSAGVFFWFFFFYQFYKILFDSHYLLKYCLFLISLSSFGTSIKSMVNLFLFILQVFLFLNFHFFILCQTWTIPLALSTGSQILPVSCNLMCVSGFSYVAIFFIFKSSSFQICMIVLLFFYFPKLLFYFFKYMEYFFYIWYTIVPNSKDSVCVYVCGFFSFVLFCFHCTLFLQVLTHTAWFPCMFCAFLTMHAQLSWNFICGNDLKHCRIWTYI